MTEVARAKTMPGEDWYFACCMAVSTRLNHATSWKAKLRRHLLFRRARMLPKTERLTRFCGATRRSCAMWQAARERQ